MAAPLRIGILRRAFLDLAQMSPSDFKWIGWLFGTLIVGPGVAFLVTGPLAEADLWRPPPSLAWLANWVIGFGLLAGLKLYAQKYLLATAAKWGEEIEPEVLAQFISVGDASRILVEQVGLCVVAALIVSVLPSSCYSWDVWDL